MREILAFTIFLIVLQCVFHPEELGSWLRQVDNARFLDLDRE